MIWRSFLHVEVGRLLYRHISVILQISVKKSNFTSISYYQNIIMAPRKAAASEKATKNGTKAVEDKPKRGRSKAQAENNEPDSTVNDEEPVETPVEKVKASNNKNDKNEKPKKKGPAKKAVKDAKVEKEKEESVENGEDDNNKKEKVERRTAPKRAASTKEAKKEEVVVEKKTKKAPAKSAAAKKKGTKAAKNEEKEVPEEVEEEVDDAAPEKEEEEEEPVVEKKKGNTRKRNVTKAKEVDEEPAPKKTKETKTAAPLKNATLTNWSDINFKTTKLNENKQEYNFHITSWNVDGIRAWYKKGGLDILTYDDPDILCIQETKCNTDKIPPELIESTNKYKAYWCDSEKEGYAGVGILSKIMPIEVHYGIGSKEHDSEGRCITAEYKLFYLVNVYVPNAGAKLVTLPKRLEWNKLFKEYIKKLNDRKPVIVCGDLNVAHTEIDLKNPKTNTKNAGFTPEEREGFTEFLADGFVDTYRKLYPDETDCYTFWSYKMNARTKNVGWRLDYFVVSENFMKRVCDNVIHSKVLGSDHCPISLYFQV